MLTEHSKPIDQSLPTSRAILEIILSIALLLGVSHFLFPKDWSLAGLNPSPVFILSLVFALRYSLAMSIVSSLLLSSIFFYLKWIQGNYLDLQEFFEIKNLYAPIISVAISSAIAWIQQDQNRIRENFKANTIEWQQELSSLRQALQSREDTLNELAGRISERGESWASLQDFGKNLWSKNPEHLRSALIYQATTLLGTKRIAWYEKQGEILQLIQHHSDSGELPQTLPLQTGIASIAFQSGQLVSVADPNIETQTDDLHLALGLLNKEGGREGVLVAFKVAFPRMHKENMRHLRIASSWYMDALENFREWTLLNQSAIWNPEQQSYNLFYLDQLVHQATANCVRYGGTYSLCCLRVSYQQGDTKVLRNIEAHLLRQFLRTGDILAKGDHESEWWIFLPSTPQIGAERAMEKLVESITLFFGNSELSPTWTWKTTAWIDEKNGAEIWAKSRINP